LGPNRLDIFAIGADENDRICLRYAWNGNTWEGWTRASNDRGEGRVSATSWGENRIDIMFPYSRGNFYDSGGVFSGFYRLRWDTNYEPPTQPIITYLELTNQIVTNQEVQVIIVRWTNQSANRTDTRLEIFRDPISGAGSNLGSLGYSNWQIARDSSNEFWDWNFVPGSLNSYRITVSDLYNYISRSPIAQIRIPETTPPTTPPITTTRTIRLHVGVNTSPSIDSRPMRLDSASFNIIGPGVNMPSAIAVRYADGSFFTDIQVPNPPADSTAIYGVIATVFFSVFYREVGHSGEWSGPHGPLSSFPVVSVPVQTQDLVVNFMLTYTREAGTHISHTVSLL
jgi:hypothetical protein